MAEEKPPGKGDQVDQVVKQYHQISKLFDYLSGQYPMRQAIGLFLLILIALVTAVLGLMAKNTSFYTHVLVAVILAASLVLLSVSIGQAQFAKLERQSLDAFARLSLLERTEEDRREVAAVVAITAFLEVSKNKADYDFANFFQALGRLLEGSDVVTLRGKLRQWLDSADQGRWRPSYLRHYVRALRGICFLTAQPSDVREALKEIDEAQQALEKDHPDAQVSAILNGRAICHALLADGTKDFTARIGLMADALRDFAKAGRKDEGKPPGMYRFRVNYAEWCVRMFGEWEQDPTRRAELEVRLVATFATVSTSFRELFPVSVGSAAREQALPLLFESAARAVKEADTLATGVTMGRGRAVVHLVGFYLGVAAHAWQARGGAPSAALQQEFTSVGALANRLDNVFRLWRDQLTEDDIRKKIHDLPHLDQWLEEWPDARKRFGERLHSFAPVPPPDPPPPPAAPQALVPKADLAHV